MTKIFTIGTNGKSPKRFFDLLTQNKIDLLLDIRLNGKSQLAGFAKGGNDYLGFLTNKIANIDYIYDPTFAPSSEILDKYHNDHNWDYYTEKFEGIIKRRDMKNSFAQKYSKYENVCLLCAEETPEKCHRRLVAEAIVSKNEIIHL